MITINIPLEKEYFLTSQQVYDIISAAIEDAYDNGFINQYVFYRSVFSHMLVTLNEADEVAAANKHLDIHLAPLEFWNNNLDDIEKMLDEHKKDLAYFDDIASNWIKDYIEYAYSLRGLLDNLTGSIGNMLNNATEDYEKMSSDEELKKLLDTAQNWGMDNPKATVKEEKKPKIISADSLMQS